MNNDAALKLVKHLIELKKKKVKPEAVMVVVLQ